MEETHNTLKFAQRAKRVTVQATPNRVRNTFHEVWSRCLRIHEVCVKYTSAVIHALQIVDEKQLLKRYQKEIVSLKEELNQLKRGTPEEDLISIREEVLIFVL